MTVNGFTPEQTAAVLMRDGYKCAMCGERARVANHRSNRGSGGFKGGNTLANACALCHDCNGLIESDAEFAAEARRRGVKLSRYDDPTVIRYLSPLFGMWVYLHDDRLTIAEADEQMSNATADTAEVP